eukprot:gene7521-5303_t
MGGKRKKSNNGPVKKESKYKIPSRFDCPVCDQKGCIAVKILRSEGVATVRCTSCGVGQGLNFSIRPLEKSVDVFFQFHEQLLQVDRAEVQEHVQSSTGRGAAGAGRPAVVEEAGDAMEAYYLAPTLGDDGGEDYLDEAFRMQLRSFYICVKSESDLLPPPPKGKKETKRKKTRIAIKILLIPQREAGGVHIYYIFPLSNHDTRHTYPMEWLTPGEGRKLLNRNLKEFGHFTTTPLPPTTSLGYLLAALRKMRGVEPPAVPPYPFIILQCSMGGGEAGSPIHYCGTVCSEVLEPVFHGIVSRLLRFWWGHSSFEMISAVFLYRNAAPTTAQGEVAPPQGKCVFSF